VIGALAKPYHGTAVSPVGQQQLPAAGRAPAGPQLLLLIEEEEQLGQLACRRLLVVLGSGLLAEGLGTVLAVLLVLQMPAGGRAAAAAGWLHVLQAVMRARG